MPVKLVINIFFVMFSVLVVLPSSVFANVPLFSRSYALVVGIDQYPSSLWPSLDYARKDAIAMATFLGNQGYEVRTLFDTQATRARILRELRGHLARKLGPDDRVVVFFSGHGETVERAGRDFGYIIPHDGGDDSSNWISMAEMRDISNQLANARHQLFIFDSCYGGQFAAKGLLSSITADHPRYIEKISENKARQYITAGGKGERVRAGGPDGYSYFTGYLLRALSGKADLNGDSYVTSSELDAYLQPAASNWDHTPIAGVLPGHEQGNFWFRVMDEDMVAKVLPERGIFARLSNALMKGDEEERDMATAMPETLDETPTFRHTNQCRLKENLTKIKGIGEKTQRILYEMGYCTFEDIEKLTSQGMAEIVERMFWTQESIYTEEEGYTTWQEQAAALRACPKGNC